VYGYAGSDPGAEPHQLGNCHVLYDRFLTGPSKKVVPMTTAAIFLPVALSMYVFGEEGARLPPAACRVFSFLLAMAVEVCLLQTALCDPGIIPRLGTQYDGRLKEWRLKEPPRVVDCSLNTYAIRVKFCATCNVYRPPRAVHCKTCDNCVERFDHHCPWVGTCIGKRNYRWFLGFVSTCASLCIFTMAVIIDILRAKMEPQVLSDGTHEVQEDKLAVMMGDPAATFLIFYTFFAGLFTASLTAFHTYLVVFNMTTYEALMSVNMHGNPYTLGALGNLLQAFARPRPGYLDLKSAKVLWGPCMDEYGEGELGVAASDAKVELGDVELELPKRGRKAEDAGESRFRGDKDDAAGDERPTAVSAPLQV